jgi:hypothetical protein
MSSVVGMIILGRKKIVLKETAPNATSFTANSTWTVLRVELGLGVVLLPSEF